MLAHEPMVLSMRSDGSGGVQVRRQVPDDVVRLRVGDACGDGQGICEDGLRCRGRVCVGTSATPDAGLPDAGDTGSREPPS